MSLAIHEHGEVFTFGVSMMKINLYEITQEFEALDNMLIETGGEITEESEELEQYINGLLMSKVDGCVEYRTQQMDRIEMAKARVKKFQELIKTEENKVKRFDNYIIDCLERLEKPEVAGQLHTIKVHKPQKSVKIIDEDKIPAEFATVETVVKINKSEIKKALKSGVEMEGACLVDGKKSLNIK